MAWNCPVCGYKCETFQSYANHYNLKRDEEHTGNALAASVGCDKLRDLYDALSESALADHLGTGRTAVQNALEYCDISRRGQSAAERHKWDQMSSAERERRVQELSDEFHEMMEADVISEWREENQEQFQHVVKKAAPKGAPAREENGMAGRTGQSNPNWRGGKSVYDAVKKQLGERSWNYLQNNVREDACANCGTGDAQLDLHHIIPLLAGGTNEAWNLVTLCSSCHRITETRLRQLPEFKPVLVE